MNKLTVIKYTFEPYFNGSFQEGEFYDKNNRLLKQKYYNGRVCIDSYGKRYGIKKLRIFAKKHEVELIELPF